MDDTSVHPDHQRRGVGSVLLEYGVRKADELGIECFVEATDEGMGLYKKFGFMNLTKVLVDAENGTTERHQMIQKLTPQPVKYWAMWRPKGGVVEEGEPKTLWEALAAAHTV
jgi:predicted N-acetyltransferase YhbS